MKIKAMFLSTTLVVLFAISLHSQDTKTFTHPSQSFSFEATGEWQLVPNHQDKMIYEMINPENDIHVMLWYNGGTESSCEAYLNKMADMKGLSFDKPIKKDFDNKTIWILECTGTDNETQIKNILAAMSYVKPYDEDAPARCQGKSYNNMHIAQVWCPESRYKQNQDIMNGIIASLELESQ